VAGLNAVETPEGSTRERIRAENIIYGPRESARIYSSVALEIKSFA
jgi:hypothetical protein